MIKNIIIALISITMFGCTMTATNQDGEELKLTGFGSGKAKFNNGAEIEKGLITFPPIKLDN